MTLLGEGAVVTGAGRGIGRAVALALAAEGAKVALAARTESELAAVAGEIRARGGTALAVRCDVSLASEVEALFRAAERAHGPTSLLVNNAGVVRRRPLVELTEADWDLQLDVNLKGAYLCARAALSGEAGMLARHKGRIVNVSSISGTLGTPTLTAYCASKWGLIGLTKALAEELRETGVSVMAILPGSVDTAMLSGSGFAPDMSPDDVANVIRFLCTGAPAAMTGSAVELFG
ncbi:MAG: SDR family NAD(P)-dependent oxidoreductase [Deltaproteobacteria bacterium]